MIPDEVQNPQYMRGAVSAVLVAVLILHAASFLPFISDDAFISLRYAERLLDGKGLTWTDGQRVEGYTNLLWVLACAGLGFAGVDLIFAARLWGCVGMAAGMLAVTAAFRPRAWRDCGCALLAGLGMALSAPIAVWAIGGLEQPFLLAFLLWAIVLLLPILQRGHAGWTDAIGPSVLLGLLCLTRADGGVICLGVAVGILAAWRFRPAAIRLVLQLGLFPILLGGGQLAFRLAYYGEWVPNPAFVKVALTKERLAFGAGYVWAAVPYLAGVILPGLAGLVLAGRDSRTRAAAVFLATILLLWIAYVILIGGDVFPAHRHWVPAIAILAIGTALFVQSAIRLSPRAGKAATAISVASLALLAGTQRLDPATQLAVEERWEWDGKEVGEMLGKAFGDEQPLLACDPAGCLPYFSKLPSIDMLGLNDYHIARHRRPEFGRGRLAHDLGDGAYVLSREPDLVIFRLPRGTYEPLFPSGQDMFADPDFHRAYRFLFFRTAGARGVISGIWVRLSSPRIGVRINDSRMEIPGFFAATDPQTPAVLDDQGRLGTEVPPTLAARLPGINLPPGRFRVDVGTDQELHIETLESGGRRSIARAETGRFVEFSLAAARNVDFLFGATSRAHIRRVIVTRL